MPRRSTVPSPRTPKRSKRSENPLGEESMDHTESYESPSSDPDNTHYSIENRRRKSQTPRRSQQNTSSRVPRDMDLTAAAGRQTRSSVGPNRSTDQSRPRPGPKSAHVRKQSKPKRLKPGVRALKEIRELQKSTHLLIPKLCIARVIRETIQNIARSPDMRITVEALQAIHEATEMYMVQFFEDSMRIAAHAKRVTLMVPDMKLVSFLRGNWNVL